jgi:hypothetical protein
MRVDEAVVGPHLHGIVGRDDDALAGLTKITKVTKITFVASRRP